MVQWTRLISAGIMPGMSIVLSRPIQPDVPCAIGKEVKAAKLHKGGTCYEEQRHGDDCYRDGTRQWQVVSISQDGGLLAAILANPVMIDAYRAGVPGNGKPFPDGSRMAKIHWNPKKLETFPAATVPGTLHDVDFMVKDSKRFADTGAWGWAVFKYEAASGRFTPGTSADAPPQGNDAKCGFACHTIVKTRDYVFTDYGSR